MNIKEESSEDNKTYRDKGLAELECYTINLLEESLNESDTKERKESDSEEELIGAVAQSVSKMSLRSKSSKLEEKCWYRQYKYMEENQGMVAIDFLI